MRSAIPTLTSPYPLATLLPPPLQEDDLAVALTAALDDVLSPLISVLDCLDSYVDPDLAPPDFLAWLAEWVGVTLDENWQVARQRATVSRAIKLTKTRGTAAGLKAYLEVVTGAQVDLVESGGVEWSLKPTDNSPGDHDPRVSIRITCQEPGSVDVARVHELVTSVKPAHVHHEVEVVG